MSPKPYSRPLLLILQLLIDALIGPRQGYKQTKKPKQTNKRGKVYMSLASWGFSLKQANKNKVNINTYKMKKKKKTYRTNVLVTMECMQHKIQQDLLNHQSNF